MATLRRIVVDWTGLKGLPGNSVFYWKDVDGGPAAIRTFFNSLAGRFPVGLTIQVRGDGPKIEDSTGALVGSWVEATPAAVTGTGAGDYAAPVGTHVNWVTGLIVQGRRVRGRTFLVPMSAAVFESDGTVEAVVLTSIRDAAAALIVAAINNFVVWHRPQPGNAGSSDDVESATVPDKAAVLRSRRD